MRGPDSLALRRGARRANLELEEEGGARGGGGGAVNKLRAGPCPRGALRDLCRPPVPEPGPVPTARSSMPIAYYPVTMPTVRQSLS